MEDYRLMMRGASIAITFGVAMIALGLTRGLWQALMHGIVSFSEGIRGVPPSMRSINYGTEQREPLLALLGVAFFLLGSWAYLSA